MGPQTFPPRWTATCPESPRRQRNSVLLPLQRHAPRITHLISTDGFFTGHDRTQLSQIGLLLVPGLRVERLQALGCNTEGVGGTHPRAAARDGRGTRMDRTVQRGHSHF